MKRFILAVVLAAGVVLLIGSGASADAPSKKANSGRPPKKEKAAKLVEEGKELMRDKEYDEALEKFDEALTLDPKNVPAMTESARAHNAQEDYEDALDSAAGALRLDPNNSDGLREFGYALWKTNTDLKAASGAFLLAIKYDPKNWAAYDHLANLMDEIGEKRLAQKVRKLKADTEKAGRAGRKID